MDELYEIAFQLIVSAGNSRSNSMRAIKAAREFRFEEALEFLKQANEEFVEAHEIQTNLIQGEAQGNGKEVNLILVHAQDHLTMAMTTYENAQEFLNLYKLIDELKNK